MRLLMYCFLAGIGIFFIEQSKLALENTIFATHRLGLCKKKEHSTYNSVIQNNPVHSCRSISISVGKFINDPLYYLEPSRQRLSTDDYRKVVKRADLVDQFLFLRTSSEPGHLSFSCVACVSHFRQPVRSWAVMTVFGIDILLLFT